VLRKDQAACKRIANRFLPLRVRSREYHEKDNLTEFSYVRATALRFRPHSDGVERERETEGESLSLVIASGINKNPNG